MISNINPYSLTVTPEAIKKLINEALIANEEPIVRIAIKGGGCSGFKYDFSFAEKEDDDFVFENDGLTVLVDPISINYLNGVSVNYEKDIFSEQIVIKNPNIKTSCGCGKSFS